MSYPAAGYPDVRHHGPGEHSARLRPADTAPDLVLGPATRVHHLATGASTGGAYGMYRWEMPGPPSGPAPHFHRTMTESFYVLDGTVGLFDGVAWVDAGPGTFLHVPPGGVHAFRNASGVLAVMLLLFTPGAPREAYFEELAEISRTGRSLDAHEWLQLYARHDQHMV